VGNEALRNNTTGTLNTCIGYQAGTAITTGQDNTYIGALAGDTTTTGQNNVCIGHLCDVESVDGSNRVGVGTELVLTANNYVKLGVGGNNVSTLFASGSSWSWTSDERLKKNINTDTLGLEFINKLRPATYELKPSQEVDPSLTEHYSATEDKADSGKLKHGLIAQEVKAALDEVGVNTFAGWSEDDIDGVQRISPADFVYPLINAVKELSAEVEQLKQQLNNGE